MCNVRVCVGADKMTSRLVGGKQQHRAARFGLWSSSKLDLSSGSEVARARVCFVFVFCIDS